ncbi:MAG: two pore domain potassium channel family protein [Xanthomonadales bacterium]|nr:hypothetical protein [Xanthomonadales bacterium]MCC6593552.1 two pore domain potassium channel family protein [Xanthomonadales bacterium]
MRVRRLQPSIGLLLVLALSLVLYPFADDNRSLRTLAQLLDIGVVLSVMRMLRVHALWLRGGWAISLPLVLLQLLHLALPGWSGVQAPMLVFQVAFHAYAVVLLLRYVLHDEIVTVDELYALACIYVLLALLWASAYAIVIHYDATAIYINEANNPDGRIGWSDLVYYSMTTLTSTGYGEITPVAPPARALAMLQQVVGVLYVAILIARLTGMARGRR